MSLIWVPLIQCKLPHYTFNIHFNIILPSIPTCGPGSVVGIATGYGLDDPGIEFRWGRDFPHLFRPALGPIQPPLQWVPGLSRGKVRPSRAADHSPPPSAAVKKKKSYTSTPSMGRTACTEPQCLYKGALLYLGIPTGLLPSRFLTNTLDAPAFCPTRATCSTHLFLLGFVEILHRHVN